MGLRALPAVDLAQWKSFVADRGPKWSVPMANLVNLGICIDGPILVQFPELRILSLTNLQYDAQGPSSPYIAPLVGILRGAPHLTHLELDLRHQLGTVTVFEGFRENPPEPHNSQNHFMRALCHQHAQAGGRPLRLEALRLGFGCEFIWPPWHPAPNRLYLEELTDVAHLKELHVQDPCYKESTTLPRLRDAMGLNAITRIVSGQAKVFRGLRKITWPWNGGTLMFAWSQADRNYLQNIVLRIAEPTTRDWDVNNNTSWVTMQDVNCRH
jgi:hypothetical protein